MVLPTIQDSTNLMRIVVWGLPLNSGHSLKMVVFAEAVLPVGVLSVHTRQCSIFSAN